MGDYPEELLKAASIALEQKTAVGERGAMYYLVDFYKVIMDEVGDIIGVPSVEKMSIKHKILNLGAKLPGIHSHPELEKVEKIRQKYFHIDKGSPETDILKRLVERGPIIAKDLRDLADESNAQLADAKEMGEALKLHFERGLAELKEWLGAAEPFASLVGEKEIEALRTELKVLQEMATEMDSKTLDAEHLHALVHMQELVENAKYLYNAGDAMAADAVADQYADLYW
jgi:hypothetical protein